MAEAMIQRCWPDGETLTVSIEVTESFPDAVAEAEASCERLYAKALDVTLASDPSETDAGE
jgi:hypothetical protein